MSRKTFEAQLTNMDVIFQKTEIGVLTIPLSDGSYVMLEVNKDADELEITWKTTTHEEQTLFMAPIAIHAEYSEMRTK